MREILFKAKQIGDGEWVEGYLVKIDEDDYRIATKEDIYHSYTGYSCYDGVTTCIDKDTICQYTGLTDKNGNKIWENDILFADDITSFVRWDDEEARFVMDDYDTQGCLMEYGFDEDAGEYGVVDTYGFDDFTNSVSEIFEVISNIFDNPELLKGE